MFRKLQKEISALKHQTESEMTTLLVLLPK